MSFPRYAKYKDSGVEWLGEVPEHWVPVRFKRVLRERQERSTDGSELLLSVSAYTGVTPRSEIIDEGEHLSRAESLEGYKICRRDDLVINIMLAWNRGLGFTDYDGIVSPSYSVFRLINESLPRFLNYLVRSDEYTLYFKAFSAGVIDSRLRLYPETFGQLSCLLPPPDEQAAIAIFLDRETEKIDALIAEQHRLIELLQEKRQAVISHAVTKGLNPDVPMKDSGIEWLGEVPEHWGFGPLKRFWEVIDCKHVTVPFIDEGFPVASVMEVREFELDLSQVLRTSEEHFRLLTDGGRQPRRGDVIYCRNTANTGTSAYVDTDEPISIGQDVVLIKCKEHNGRFLNYILHSGLMAAQLETLLVGSTFKRINVAEIRSLAVTCPPKAEQDAIAAFLDARTSDYKSLSADASSAITLLQERRSALISAAVTGQIDVRGLAGSEAA